MSEGNKVSLDENGNIKVDDELLNEISGGSNLDDHDNGENDVQIVINKNCGVGGCRIPMNSGCKTGCEIK